MKNSLIRRLQTQYGQAVSTIDMPEWGGEDWFLLEINPLPYSDELPKVISDIQHNRQVGVQAGRVRHLDACKETNHKVFPKNVRKVLGDLEDETYKVAVYTGKTDLDILGGQPIAICIEPEISYFTFPDHPHLNTGWYDKRNHFHFPDSLCYTDDPAELGEDKVERLLNAFDFISIWLFRFQLWNAMREKDLKPVWIGPESDFFPPEAYPPLLDLRQRCRCGKHLTYSECHFTSDFEVLVQKSSSSKNWRTSMLQKEPQRVIMTWDVKLKQPKKESLSYLKSNM